VRRSHLVLIQQDRKDAICSKAVDSGWHAQADVGDVSASGNGRDGEESVFISKDGLDDSD
jgi:hypothetical protein